MVWIMGADDLGDIDNRIKPVLDVLKGRAYADDRQVKQLHVYQLETARPRGEIQITITRLEAR
jgi:Holliday junction resolvase RusA-like endonuclease